MNELVEGSIKIEDLIYEVRGKQVMLDSDLAKLYNVSTGNLNKAVKRNAERFPENFMFQLTTEEYKFLIFQIGISNQRGGNRKLPYVFTEQGVAMLSSVIHNETAINTSIIIMNAFVSMRHYISNNLIEQNHINNMVLIHDNEIKLLQDTFDKFKPTNNHIFFKGQIYDAYSLLLDILENSKESIIIIDNYADKKLLDLLSKTNKKIKVYSKNMNEELIKKYMSQYNNVEIIENDTFHDRFIIIDNKDLYHCGASFKELGKKCFEISKIENQEILTKIIEKIM